MDMEISGCELRWEGVTKSVSVRRGMVAFFQDAPSQQLKLTCT